MKIILRSNDFRIVFRRNDTLRIFSSGTYGKIRLSVSLLKIACPEVYIRVHFWTRVFALQKHRCCGIYGHPCPFCRYKAQAQINRRHGKQCPSLYIVYLHVCNANVLLHSRTTAVHGGSATLSTFKSGTDAARIKQKQV